MKKKLTTSQKRLLLCLVVAGIFVLSYQYIYQRYAILTEEYNQKIEMTKQAITQREQELSEEEILKLKAEELKAKEEAMIASLPVDITKVDNLIFIEQLEKDLGMDIPSVSVQDTTDFYQTQIPALQVNSTDGDSSSMSTIVGTIVDVIADTTKDSSDTSTEVTTTNNTSEASLEADSTVANDGSYDMNETTLNTGITESSGAITTDNVNPGASATTDSSSQQFMKGRISTINITFQTTYQDFKKLVDYIKHYPEKTSISSASLSFDGSTGQLLGSMTINRYALTGTGKIYEEPYIGDISIGNDNIFGDSLTQTDNSGDSTEGN